jgi:hypothetical protein
LKEGYTMNKKDEALAKFVEVVKNLSPEEFEKKYVKDSKDIDEIERKEYQEDGACDV